MKTTKQETGSIKWTKRVHPAFGSYPHSMKGLLGKCPVGKWQWLSLDKDKKFSIISPSMATFGNFELFDGEEVYRFETLKEAKEYAETLFIT